MTAFRKLLATSLSLFGSAGFAQGPIASQLAPTRADLSAYQWEARPVLIFAPDPQDPDFKDQIAELRDARPALEDRDIVVLADTDPDAHGRLRAGLAVDGFEIILVGKDGSVKLRQDQPIAAQTLIDTIDSMPMRQREMRD
ncbi:DUF4174 domain-containing protein [Sagittula sp. SSi028]|uniref:DUF4174 domain-containing protein n=1 Tax=Sagittula sp. SSi028 TaxID=3400636 RepID=UPI003AF7B2FB